MNRSKSHHKQTTQNMVTVIKSWIFLSKYNFKFWYYFLNTAVTLNLLVILVTPPPDVDKDDLGSTWVTMTPV